MDAKVIAKYLYVIMESNKRQAGPRMGKTASFLNPISPWGGSVPHEKLPLNFS